MVAGAGMDWETAGPSPEVREVFLDLARRFRPPGRPADPRVVVAEFPYTFNGRSWLLAFLLWDAFRDDLDNLHSWSPVRAAGVIDEHCPSLSVSLYQVGWAINAARQLLDLPPVVNPALRYIRPDQVVHWSRTPAPAHKSAWLDLLAFLQDGAAQC